MEHAAGVAHPALVECQLIVRRAHSYFLTQPSTNSLRRSRDHKKSGMVFVKFPYKIPS